MNSHEQLTKKLLSAYCDIMANKRNMPEWAVHMAKEPERIVSPTIPFVGKKYNVQKIKIMVYASAEVLSEYICVKNQESTRPWLDDSKIAINRHRYFFDDWKNEKKTFFPKVHIQPMNDGYLATAVHYIANKISCGISDDPEEFYESISFGNYGKFTIETEFQKNIRLCNIQEGNRNNIDYANDPIKLSASHEYLLSDISILQPDYIIMPESIYNTDRAFIDNNKGKAKIICICQLNARRVNTYLSNHYDKYSVCNLPHGTHRWFDNLYDGRENKSKAGYLSVFTYLDSAISENIK